MNAAPRRIDTPRLQLRASEPAFAAPLRDYFLRNRAHFAPWSPPQSRDFTHESAITRRLSDDESQRSAGTALRWWLLPHGEARPPVIGQVHFSQIFRGPFQSAMLGYQIDRDHEGLGLMHEALQTALAEVFGPRVRLHRVQAGVRPENVRSLKLLERLGFEHEGLARQYLFIDGAWRDHVITALRNPAWPMDEAP